MTNNCKYNQQDCISCMKNQWKKRFELVSYSMGSNFWLTFYTQYKFQTCTFESLKNQLSEFDKRLKQFPFGDH